MREVLVTGATGFIGKELVKELVKNHKVRCLVREGESICNLPDNVDIWTGDLADRESLIGICDDIDIVLHLAAEINPEPRNQSKREKLIKTNVRGTKNILSEASSTNIKKLIYFSSLSVQGKLKDRKDLTLEGPPDPRSLYGKTKLKGEELCKIFCQVTPTDLLILRPSMVYDPQEPAKEVADLVRWIDRGIVPILGTGKNVVNVIRRDKLIEQVIDLLENKKSGGMILNEENITVSDFVDRLANKRDISSFLKIKIPLKPLKHFLSFYELFCDLFEIEPTLTKKRIERLQRGIIG